MAAPVRIVSDMRDNQNTLSRKFGVYIYNRYYIWDTRFCAILIVLYIAFHTLDIIYWILYVEYMLDLICWTLAYRL